MAFKIVVTHPASEDLDQATSYISRNSAQFARQWSAQMRAAFQSLRDMPLRAARISEKGRFLFDYRQLLVQSYRVVFYVDEAAQTVFVVRVYHVSRSPLSTDDLDV